MQEIPPAKDTDAEDVVWGLQTAETLWKRGERIDALVWLRRAAQAAGDANDDDRALELARHAAELTEWMASTEEPLSSEPAGASGAAKPLASDAADALAAPPAEVQAPVEVDVEPPPPWVHTAPTTAPPAVPPRPPPPRPPSSPTMQTPEPTFSEGATTVAPGALDDEDEGRPSATSVPPAEKVHAGMFDPWADQASQLAPASPAPSSPLAPDVEPEEEVVTSVRPAALARPGSDAPLSSPALAPARPVAIVPPPRPSRPSVGAKPKAPPPLPPRARPPAPKPSAPAVVAAVPSAGADAATEVDVDVDVDEAASLPPPGAPAEAPAASASVEAPPAAETSPTEVEPAPSEASAVEAASAPAPAEASPAEPAPSEPASAEAAAAPLDLDDVEAFADLPDDARTDFAAAATIHALAEGEEIGTFALAYVVSGSFDVAATVVDAPAVRLADGAVLRARGTTDENVPIRFICATPRGVLATWSDASVDEAFRTIPWVEDDLRAAADRVQTLVGITIGPLGERLDVSIREEIVGRLTMRPLVAGELVVQEGEPVPGLLLVGIGELELVKDDEVVGAVGSGDFLFPTEVLGAGSAPSTARAGSGGALVMFGDRRIAQELLVTCPPLLEVFAGM